MAEAGVLSPAVTRPLVAWRVVLAFSIRRSYRGALAWGLTGGLLLAATSSLYSRTYPDAAGRALLASSLAQNKGITALLGTPYNIATTGGFVAWRAGTALAVIVAIWGLLAGTRLLRGEEEAHRWDNLVSRPITAAGATFASLVGLGVSATAIFACLLGSLALSLPEGDYSSRDALAYAAGYTSIALFFAAVGALMSQLASIRRTANLAGGAVLIAAFVVRVIGDGSSTMGWLVWTTPAGWLEEIRPFGGARFWPLLLLAGLTAALGAVAVALARRRDAGAALVVRADLGRTSGWMLGEPASDAFRFTRAGLIGWAAGAAVAAATFGALGPGAVRTIVESDMAERFGSTLPVEITTVAGYLSFSFLFVGGVLVSLVTASHLSAMRDEEATGRLDLVLSTGLGRRHWLWSRVTVAIASATLVALVAGFTGWAGQATQGGDVGLGSMLGASLGFVPVAALFCGLGVWFFGFIPRAAAASVWALVATTFLIELIGSMLDAPKWILALSPFYHLAPAPLRPVNLVSSSVMAGLGILLMLAGTEGFARRDTASS